MVYIKTKEKIWTPLGYEYHVSQLPISGQDAQAHRFQSEVNLLSKKKKKKKEQAANILGSYLSKKAEKDKCINARPKKTKHPSAKIRVTQISNNYRLQLTFKPFSRISSALGPRTVQ